MITLRELGDKAIGAIGLAMLPLDGMVSMDGPKNEFGQLVTRSFGFQGQNLYLNLDGAMQEASAAGSCDIRVEILGPNHEPMSGFTFDDALPITEGGRSIRATWKGHGDLLALEGKTIRLKFHIRNAKLYSFRFQ